MAPAPVGVDVFPSLADIGLPSAAQSHPHVSAHRLSAACLPLETLHHCICVYVWTHSNVMSCVMCPLLGCEGKIEMINTEEIIISGGLPPGVLPRVIRTLVERRK